MRVRGSNNIVLTDPTLLRYTSAITEQKKCCNWELLARKFDRFQTLRNISQSAQSLKPVKLMSHMQTDARTNNTLGPTMLRVVAFVGK